MSQRCKKAGSQWMLALGLVGASLLLGLVGCGGSASQVLPPMLSSSTSIQGIYEGTLTTTLETGSEASLLIEEDHTFSLVTDSGLQLVGQLSAVNPQIYSGTAVLSYAEDTLGPTLAVNLALTFNTQGVVSASLSGGTVGSFSVVPATEATAVSSAVNLTQLAGRYEAQPRSISTRLATQWTLSSSGALTGSDAASTYSGAVTQPRPDRNPFGLNVTRQLTAPSIPAASFVGRLWFLPAKATRPARMVIAARRVTEGPRGLAGIFTRP